MCPEALKLFLLRAIDKNEEVGCSKSNDDANTGRNKETS
jgi:hypothetical protein